MEARETNRTAISLVGLLAVVLLSSVGCQKFDLERPIPWMGASEQAEPPVRLVAVWTDAVLHQPGKTAQRGFGGRVLFYNKENGEPIEAEGVLVVYAFEEDPTGLPSAAPDRKFVFPADQFVRHYSMCKLGHSYSFWLPWGAAGGEKKEITLIARFQPKEGGLIVGESSRQLLPGTAPSPSPSENQVDRPAVRQAGNDRPSGVQPVGYHQDTPQKRNVPQPVENENRRRMTTTTISLGNRLGRTPVAAPSVPAGISPGTARYAAPISAAVPTANQAAGESTRDATRFAPDRRRVLGRPLTRPDAARASWRQNREE